jgi:hypothetical protein
MILQTGGVGVGRDLDEVQPGLLGQIASPVPRIDDAKVLALGTDQPNFGSPDASVDAGASLAHRRVRCGVCGLWPFSFWLWLERWRVK